MIIVTPYDQGKDLGAAYNKVMKLIPEDEHACIMDIDAMFLTGRQPAIIQEYIKLYPNAVLTCYTNRVSPLSRQLLHRKINDNSDVRTHITCAKLMEIKPMSVRKVTNTISGFLMVVPKAVWNRVPFIEGIGCLGVDTWFSKQLHKHKIEILIMETVYVFHQYRLEYGIYNKNHLQV